MELKKDSVVHCLFEQSGTYKQVFNNLGYKAYDYDISNQFNQTDYVIDLFKEIENAHNDKPSIFDNIKQDDLIISFFPCTYFSVQNNLIWSKKVYNFKTWSKQKIDDYIKDRLKQRELFYNTLLKYIDVVKKRKIKTVIENPYSGNYLLTQKKIKKPSLIIDDRSKLGDNHIKPTAFWFYNFEPSFFSEFIYKNNSKVLIHNEIKGILRSQMHIDFAKNFVNKYILGV
jgi:hypothetical protein